MTQGRSAPHPAQSRGGTLRSGRPLRSRSPEGGEAQSPAGALFDRLAAGEVPPADASVTVLPAPSGARAAVVGGTAWHVVAADVDPAWVAGAVAHDPLAAPLGARFLSALADRVGAEPGVLDALLVAPHAAAAVLGLVPATREEHPRVRRAHDFRSGVRVWTTPAGDGLLTLGRGLAGRWEVSVEVEPAVRGRGLGTALAMAAPALLPAGTALWAQVAPANTASLRAFLAAGYRPVAAEVLFGP